MSVSTLLYCQIVAEHVLTSLLTITGEKYHEIVQNNPGNLLKALNAPPPAPPPTPTHPPGSAAAKAAAAEAVHGSWATYKKMLAKYAHDSQSSWTPNHEKKRKRAAKQLKAATKLEDQLLTAALPEFKLIKQDYPEMFTNGKCPCPAGFTFGDAAALADRLKDDIMAETSKLNKTVRRQKENPAHWEEPPAAKDPNAEFKPSTQDIEGSPAPVPVTNATKTEAKPAASVEAKPATWWE